VEVAGRIRAVSVERMDRPGRYRVTVDGAPLALDVARTDAHGLSVLRDAGVTARGRDEGTETASYHLSVTPGSGPGELLVTFGGRTFPVTLNGRRSGHPSSGTGASDGDIAISAPMPGRIVRVLAAPGDEVAARQAVVVVEAMKMENELRSPRAGRVKEVTVSAGMSVEAGRVLAVIE
jgi:biotin carboxyl carrier protein